MIRVRSAIADSDLRRKLRGKVPREAFAVPECAKPTYPTSLLRVFPDDNIGRYAYLGIITEQLLQYEHVDSEVLSMVCLRNSIVIPDKVLSLATTKRYIQNVNITRKLIEEASSEETLHYDVELTQADCDVAGHPDIVTRSQIFEVKTTGQLKSGWADFVLQTFAYAALFPTAKKIHIVLPLSEFVWSFSVEDWKKRNLFLDLLKGYREPTADFQYADAMFARFPIGYHVRKDKRIASTLRNLEDFYRPWQIFFTKSTKFTISDEDVAESLDLVLKHNIKLYVHAPYLVNLCIDPDKDEYVVKCLQKHLQYASAIGAKGVVVHVGKACDKPIDQALKNMKTNLLSAMADASPSCPLLLETPAGQGSELLTNSSEFIEFVTEIDDPRIGMCLDTCHTFATGKLPNEYIEQVLSGARPEILKLIHFNDSKEPLGSRKDRHALLGCGVIGADVLLQCANAAQINNIPMVIE